jgi:hypothetical protein
MNSNDSFSTSDLSLASALLSLGYRLEVVEKQYPKSLFLFQRTKYLDEAVQGFWSGELRIEPKSYFNCLKEIKSRLYA